MMNEKQKVEDIRDFGWHKATLIKEKLEKLEYRLLELKSEVEDYEARIYFKKMKKTVYERISNVESSKQYYKIVGLIEEINDSDSEIDYLEELVAIKYDVEGEECIHAKNDLKCKCK